MPAQPSREFLMHSISTYHSLSWCIPQQILKSRLEKKYPGRAREMILRRLPAYDDPSQTISKFLSQHRNDSLDKMLQEMDVLISIRLLLDRELGILPEKRGRDLLYMLRDKRNEGLSHFGDTSLTNEENALRLWKNDHENLAETAGFFRADLPAEIYEQAVAYGNGTGGPYQPLGIDPAEKFRRRIESGKGDEMLNDLLDSDQAEELRRLYAGFPGVIDRYIDCNSGGADRSRKAVRLLAPAVYRYALLYADQMKFEQAVDYLTKLLDSFPDHAGDTLYRISLLFSGAEARIQRRAALALGCRQAEGHILQELDMHVQDLEALSREEWCTLSADIKAVISLMPVETQAHFADRMNMGWFLSLQTALSGSLQDQLIWLRDKRLHFIPNDKSLAILEEATDEISRAYWRSELEKLRGYLPLAYPDNMLYLSETAYTSLVRTNSREYEEWHALFVPFDKNRQLERRLIARTQMIDARQKAMAGIDSISGKFRADEEKALAAADKKTPAALQSFLDSIPDRIASVHSLVSAYNSQTKQIIQSMGYFLPDDAEEDEKKQHQDLMTALRFVEERARTLLGEMEQRKKALKKQIDDLEKKIARQKRMKKFFRFVLTVLVLAAAWFGVRTIVSNSAKTKAEDGQLLEAYSLLDKTSFVLALEDQRADCLHSIRMTMIENGYRQDTGLPEKPRPVDLLESCGLPADLETVPSSSFVAYETADGYRAAHIYDGIELRVPDGLELTDIWSSYSGNYDQNLIIRGLCADGTLLYGYIEDADPQVMLETGIDLARDNYEGQIRELIWREGAPWFWMEDGTLCNENFVPYLYEVACFDGDTPLREDMGIAWEDQNREAEGRPIWEARFPYFTVTVDGHMKLGDYNDQMMRWESGDWFKGNDWLFTDSWQESSALNVYSEEVRDWL